MHWERQEVADDQGPGRRYDVRHVAVDKKRGVEWIVFKHDDDTWQWMQWHVASDEPINMAEGFTSAEDAEASAERYAATLAVPL